MTQASVIRANGEDRGSEMKSTKHILVVDDSQAVGVLLSRALQAEGFEVTVVKDGFDAYEMGLEGEFDLVLLDHLLPGLLGREILHRWRSEGVEVPVIMLSIDNDEDDITSALEMGAQDYVRKPFSMRELMARVRIHVGSGRG